MKANFMPIYLILISINLNFSKQSLMKPEVKPSKPQLTPEMKEMSNNMFKALQDVLVESIVPDRNLLLSRKKEHEYIKKKEIKLVMQRKKSID